MDEPPVYPHIYTIRFEHGSWHVWALVVNSEAQTPFSECIPIAPCVGASGHFDNTTDGILHNPMCFLRTVAIDVFSLCVVKIVKIMTTSGVRTLFQIPVLRIRNYRISSGSLDP
jgi:hypothetical protein